MIPKLTSWSEIIFTETFRPEKEEASKEEASKEEVSWDSHTQFLLACLAFGVGLGNVWRFPYLVQKYGGGSFIIPFLVMMFVEAMPLLLIELGLGQKFRSGSVGIWKKLHPYFQGILHIEHTNFEENGYFYELQLENWNQSHSNKVWWLFLTQFPA